MCVFEAAVQAVVTHAVAIAVAGLLVQHRGNLRRQFIGMRLIRKLRVWAEKLILGEDRRQLGIRRRRSRVEMRNSRIAFRLQPPADTIVTMRNRIADAKTRVRMPINL